MKLILNYLVENVVLKFLPYLFAFLVFNNIHADEKSSTICVFCDESVLNYQKFYEDEIVIVLYTHKPIFPGHSLVIPKRHVELFEDLSNEEILHIGQIIKLVNIAVKQVFNTSAYLILQKNGREVGQTVSHVHFHYIPRKTGDSSILKFMFKMLLQTFLNPIDQKKMNDTVYQLKLAMQSANL